MTVAEKIIMEDGTAIAKSPVDWLKLKGKTVLVSGANGYVPQYFVHGLLKRNEQFHDGIKVVAMCRSRERANMRFGAYAGRQDFELVLQDVCEPIGYQGRVDYIIHAASPAGMKSRHDDPLATFSANVTGCGNLLQLAQEKGAGFLLVSSVDVYGEFPDLGRLAEGRHGGLNPLEIKNVYACAKRAAETLCACYAHRGVPCKIARPFQILAGGIGLEDGRLHSDFISQMLGKGEIVLKGDGAPRRSFLYVTDAIVGMLTILLEGKSGEAYNLCTEEGEASVLELAQIMASLAKGRRIQVTYDMQARKTDPAVTRALPAVCGSWDKIRSLGWKPEVSLGEACRRMMLYYGVMEGE